jgi:FkbM family methyltransferase
MKKRLTKVCALASQALNLKSTSIDGVRVSTDLRHVSSSMRSGLFHRSFEGAERDFLRRVLRRGDRVLDLGASTGLTALIAAQIVGPSNVLAYEANPHLEAMIRHNFKLNRLSPQLRMRAVTADGRNVALHLPGEAVASSIFQIGAGSLEVPSDAFGDIVQEFRPTVISMDVEGAEGEIVACGEFASIRALIIETHPTITGADVSRRVEAKLLQAGFVQSDVRRNTSLFVRPPS